MSGPGTEVPAPDEEPGRLWPAEELTTRGYAEDIRMVPHDSGDPPTSGRRKRSKKRKNKGRRRGGVPLPRYVSYAPIAAAAWWWHPCDGTWDIKQLIIALGVVVSGIVESIRAAK